MKPTKHPQRDRPGTRARRMQDRFTRARRVMQVLSILVNPRLGVSTAQSSCSLICEPCSHFASLGVFTSRTTEDTVVGGPVGKLIAYRKHGQARQHWHGESFSVASFRAANPPVVPKFFELAADYDFSNTDSCLCLCLTSWARPRSHRLFSLTTPSIPDSQLLLSSTSAIILVPLSIVGLSHVLALFLSIH